MPLTAAKKIASNSANKRRRINSAPDLYRRTAPTEVPPGVEVVTKDDDEDGAYETPSDAHAAILLILSELPESLDLKIPRIVFQHQVYTIVTNRTLADKQLEVLRKDNVIRIFKLGSQPDEVAIMLSSDYSKHVRGLVTDKAVAQAFLNAIKNEHSVSISKHALIKAGSLSQDMLRLLINHCCVTIRDVQSLWISIPNAGSFTRNLRKGRAHVKQVVQTSKLREILERDLLKRKLKCSLLGMRYHLTDIIGAGEIVSIQTTMGPLLKLPA